MIVPIASVISAVEHYDIAQLTCVTGVLTALDRFCIGLGGLEMALHPPTSYHMYDSILKLVKSTIQSTDVTTF